ncbi:MAG: VWA domain-containing protein [Methylococcales bacterium]|nr:VWA domain-containing protein [Methylococcales bacterium]
MNVADFHFIRPYWLLTTLPTLVIVVLMVRNKLSQGNWAACCDAELLPFLLQEKTVNHSRLLLATGAIATLLIVVALAGPTWQRLPSPVFRNEAALVIALNLSTSMDAADIKPSRLTIARYKIVDILKQRKDGKTALLVYSGDVFTVTPLTNDTNTIESQLAALTTDIMPSQGNNTESVLEKSVALFKQTGLQTGPILLITDAVDLDEALPAVKKLDNFQLSVLGVGTADGAPIALPEGGFLKDEQGSIVVTKLNETDLRTLAQAGHGRYQTLTTDDSDIQSLMNAFDKPVQQQSKADDNVMLEQWDDKGAWLLLLVLPLGALFFRKGLLVVALLLLLPLPKNSYALDWQDLWQRPDQQALKAYQQQDYAKAAEKFDNPDWKAAAHYQAGEYDKALKTYQTQAKQTEDSVYNQGNALAQAGQLKEALAAYEQALKFNPNDADAQFNKDLVEKELEKQQQQQDKQDKQDKKDDKQEQNKQEKSDQKKSDKQQSSDNKDQQDQQKNEKSEQQEQQNKEEKNTQPEDEQKSQKQEKGQDELAKQEELKSKEQPKQQAEPQEEQKKDDAKKSPAQAVKPSDAPAKDEKQQANEQWLNRIPDDPAGLLKRKFKYQYERNQ